jgi:hypothetical protein
LVIQGARREALPLVREGLSLADRLGHKGWLPSVLASVSAAIVEQRPSDAATLLGAAQSLQQAMGVDATAIPEMGSLFIFAVKEAEQALGQDDFELAFERGRSLETDETLELARIALA